MNSVNLTGRLTRDPEIRYTDAGLSIARFSIAVDRRFYKDGEQSADFINIVSFGKTAEFIEKWFKKGTKIEVSGRIQTGSYTNNGGVKVYTTDVVAEQVGFAESKNLQNSGANSLSESQDDVFMNIPDGVIDEEMPFN